MSINMNEEESEVVEGISRIIRAASMSAMQLREAAERRQQKAEKMTEAERAQHAQEQHAQTATDRRVADSVYKSVQSPMFWNHADNARIAERMTVAQQLAGEHGKADSAFMLASDVLRDKYGIDAVSIMHGQGSPMDRQNELLSALDHHNAAGRLRDESVKQEATASAQAPAVKKATPDSAKGHASEPSQTALEREQSTASEWVAEHYPNQTVPNAHTLYAEAQILGHTPDKPPALDPSLSGMEVDWDTKLAARDELAQSVGLDSGALMDAMDSRSVPNIERMYASEQAGSLHQRWSFDGADKLGDAMVAYVDKNGTVPETQLQREAGTIPQREEYPELLKSAAEREAQHVGMSTQDYLDHLEPTQHRLLLHSQNPSNGVYERGHELMAQYRQSYAQESYAHYQNAAEGERQEAGKQLGTAHDAEEASQRADTAYSDHLLLAAGPEADEANMSPAEYLDVLSDDQRQTLVDEHDRGIEDSVDRDTRVEEAREQADASAADQRSFDTEADTAKDDAALARQSETENLSRAEQSLRGPDHQQTMDKHLSSVARKDPQAAEARRFSLKNVPGSAGDYKLKSMGSTVKPRKASASSQTPSREHVHQR